MPFLENQLDFLRLIQEMRTPCLDAIFRFLNYFDSAYFIFFLIPFIWMGFSWKWGIKLFLILILSSLLNDYFKNIFELPRPSHIDPSLGLVSLSSFGLPSGGAQTALLLGALFIRYSSLALRWPIGLTYIILISFSRLYLGVHFPLDIIGGWTIALCLILLFIFFQRKTEKILIEEPTLGLTSFFAICFAIMAIFHQPKIYYMCTFAICGGIGAFISIHYHLFLEKPKKVWLGILRGFITASVTISIYIFTTHFLPFHTAKSLSLIIQAILLSTWISLAASPLFRLLKLGK